MGVNIQFSQSYHWMSSWILANIIQLVTQDFCDRFVDYRMDHGRRLYDQMVMAACCAETAMCGQSGMPTERQSGNCGLTSRSIRQTIYMMPPSISSSKKANSADG